MGDIVGELLRDADRMKRGVPGKRKIALDKIRLDGDTQPRAALDDDLIREYTELYRARVKMPPVVVFHDGIDYWLADGFHRWFAARKADLDKIPCEVRKGTREDARWYSYSANQTHGLRRSREDKQKAVKAALRHPKGVKMSDRQIAEHVGVSHTYVAKIRGQLESTGNVSSQSTRQGRDGRTIDTANIGRKGRVPRAVAEALDECPASSDDPGNGVAVRVFRPEQPDPVTIDVAKGEPEPKHGDPKHVLTELYAKNVTDCVVSELKRIPRANPHRGKAFSKVAKWIKRNQYGDSEHGDFSQARDLIDDLQKVVRRLHKATPGGKFLRSTRILQYLRDASKALENGTPDSVCPVCNGKKCDHCRYIGSVPHGDVKWMTEATAEPASPPPAPPQQPATATGTTETTAATE